MSNTSKITDLMTTVDSTVFETPTGPMVWGAVDICYHVGGLEPRVTIKVPIPALKDQSDEQRRAETLQRARKLIDHACSTLQPEEERFGRLPEILEGLGQELGMLPPRTQPN